MTARSNASASRPSRDGGRDDDLDEDAGLGRALGRARLRRPVGHDGDRPPGETDLAGDRREASAVGAANLHQAIAHFHAGHADDQLVRIVAPPEQGHPHLMI